MLKPILRPILKSILQPVLSHSSYSDYVYLFDSGNSDYLQLSQPFTGTVKVLLAAASTTGIHSDVLTGIQTSFTPSTNLPSSPQWNWFEASVTDLDYIVNDTFSGMILYAKDDVWMSMSDGVIDADVSVIAMMGQSNMSGRGVIESGVDDDITDLVDRVTQYSSEGHRTKPVDYTLEWNDDDAQGGVWRTMCLGLEGDIQLALGALGNTGFTDGNWVGGGGLYNRAVYAINSSMDITGAKMRAVVWLQGEDDCADMTEAAYLTALQDMRNRLISDCPSVVDDTLWVTAPIRGIVSGKENINAALATFASSIPNGAIVQSDDLTLRDALHLDMASYRTLGTRIAEAIANV